MDLTRTITVDKLRKTVLETALRASAVAYLQDIDTRWRESGDYSEPYLPMLYSILFTPVAEELDAERSTAEFIIKHTVPEREPLPPPLRMMARVQQLADADLNADNGVVETVQVVVSSSNGELETVTLTEVDVDDAVFFGSLASAAGGAGTDDDGTINGIKGDVLTLTYDDVVTALGDQVDRTDTDQVVNPFGDADGNLSVQAFDAAQTLLHVLVPHLTGLELIQAAALQIRQQR